MYKFTTPHSKQLTFLIIGFVVLVAIIATGVVRGASTFGPNAGAPDGNVSIKCAADEFLNGVGIGAECKNPLAGIPPCVDGLLYNDADDGDPTNLICYNFLLGDESEENIVDDAGRKRIHELSCDDRTPDVYVTEIRWDPGTKKFDVHCVSQEMLVGRASQIES